MKKGYKQHPEGSDLLYLPQPILEKYYLYEYRYIKIKSYDKIPVPACCFSSLKYHKIDISETPIHEYAKGFIDGYNCNLIPFIDTIDSRKELLFYETFRKGAKGFSLYHTGKGTIEFPEMYESGVFEGKRYKAWEIIFQTPNTFIKWFLTPQQAETEQTKLTLSAIAIMYFFIWKYESGTEITKTNAAKIAKDKGYEASTSGEQLYRDYEKFKQDNERTRINKTNGRQYKEHLRRYEIILPLMQTEYSTAYKEAQKEYEYLAGK